MGKQWKQWLTLPFGAPKSLQMVSAAMKLRKVMTNLDSILKAETLLCQQGLSSRGYGFFSGYVWM